MSIPIWQVDSFTSRPFRGNPAGVCVLENPRPDQWMQSVAAEMNLSETAFLLPEEDGFRLRWFTPATEVRLCGHATLASAHVLWQEDTVDPSATILFHTLSGPLSASRRNELIELDFPSRPPHEVAPPSGLVEALEVDAQWIGCDAEDFIVVVADERAVRGLAPDFRALRRVSARGVMVTAPADDQQTDFVSRFFAPACGIDEDPVTGSAHCCLTPFWAARLGKDRMIGHQISARGGAIHVQLAGNRVMLGGHAITTLRGELLC